jgi:hypothetical protein
MARYPNASTSPGTASGSINSVSSTPRPGTLLRTMTIAAASPSVIAISVASDAYWSDRFIPVYATSSTRAAL